MQNGGYGLYCTDLIIVVEMPIMLNLPLELWLATGNPPQGLTGFGSCQPDQRFFLFIFLRQTLFKTRLLYENLWNTIFYYCVTSSAEADQL